MNINLKILPYLLTSLWETEYSKGGIPSSVRQKPSGAVERLVKSLGLEKMSNLKGVDIGCGTGRNAIYLSELGCNMLAIDFISSAVESLQMRKQRLGITNLATQIVHLTKNWSLPSSDYNLFIDTYCFFHIIKLADRLHYKSELIKHAASNSIFLLTLASTEDGYYKQHIIREDNDLQVALDPGNNIECVLYTKEQIIKFFSPEFKIIDLCVNTQSNIMHGITYKRKGYECLFTL